LSEGGVRETEADLARFLVPGTFIDSDDPEIVAFAAKLTAAADGDREKAVRLYYAVRDDIRYDPYMMGEEPRYFRASDCLKDGRGFCVPKAALLAAAGRAVGIPARVGYADVRNHLATRKLLDLLGTDLFIWHGYAELWLDGRWVKATPAFNLALCERFAVEPLEFDGTADSLFHEYDKTGRRHMVYVADRGPFEDVPAAAIVADFRVLYPRLFETLRAGRGGDFAAEAAAETTPST